MKLVIIGNSGSGKTWLAEKLAEDTMTPLVHLDEIFWQPGGFDKKRDVDEVSRLVLKACAQPNWIVEGVFGELAEGFLPDADTLIWLDIDWQTCRSRLRGRSAESSTHMGRRQSCSDIENLIVWAAAYHHRNDTRSHEGHESLFDSFQGFKIQLIDEAAVYEYLSGRR